MADETKLAGVNVPSVGSIGRVLVGPYMAGFEVATHGRFWVAAEGAIRGQLFS